MNFRALAHKLLAESLATDRIAAAKKRYTDLGDDVLDMISEADPDRDKANAMWVARQTSSGNLRLPEDTGRVRTALSAFMRLKRIGVVTGAAADLLRYKTLAALESLVDEHSGTKSQGERVRFSQQAGAKSIFRGGPFEFVRITTQEAASKLCRDTKWCVKDPRWGGEYFEAGRDSYPVMVLKNGAPWALLDEKSKQAKGVDDQEITRPMIEELMPYVDHLGINEIDQLEGISGWLASGLVQWNNIPGGLRRHPRVARLMADNMHITDFASMPREMVVALAKDPHDSFRVAEKIILERGRIEKKSRIANREFFNKLVLAIPRPMAGAIGRLNPDRFLEAEVSQSPIGDAMRYLPWRDMKWLCQSPTMARMWMERGEEFSHFQEKAMRIVAKSPADVTKIVQYLRHSEEGRAKLATLPDWFKTGVFKHTYHNNSEHDSASYDVFADMTWQEIAKQNPTPMTAVKWVIAGHRGPASAVDRLREPGVAELIATDVRASRACIGARLSSSNLPIFAHPHSDIPRAIWDKALSEGDSSRDINTSCFEDALAKGSWKDVRRYSKSRSMAGRYVKAKSAANDLGSIDEEALKIYIDNSAPDARAMAHIFYQRDTQPPEWLIKLGLSFNDGEDVPGDLYFFATTVLQNSGSRRLTKEIEGHMPPEQMSEYLIYAITAMDKQEADSIVDSLSEWYDVTDSAKLLREVLDEMPEDAYVPENLFWMSFGMEPGDETVTMDFTMVLRLVGVFRSLAKHPKLMASTSHIGHVIGKSMSPGIVAKLHQYYFENHRRDYGKFEPACMAWLGLKPMAKDKVS